jgi:signal transduction histidine kinase
MGQVQVLQMAADGKDGGTLHFSQTAKPSKDNKNDKRGFAKVGRSYNGKCRDF